MKTKELIQLAVAVLILAVAGYMVYILLVPQQGGKAKALTYEKVTPIKADFDRDALQRLTDASKVKDFYLPPDLKSGLGNSQPFTPLR